MINSDVPGTSEGDVGMEYESPQIEDLGGIAALTTQFDKLGDFPDALNPNPANLDGSIIPD
jgi:hypothetical protein